MSRLPTRGTGSAQPSAVRSPASRRPWLPTPPWAVVGAFQPGAPELDDLRATLTGRPTSCARASMPYGPAGTSWGAAYNVGRAPRSALFCRDVILLISAVRPPACEVRFVA